MTRVVRSGGQILLWLSFYLYWSPRLSILLVLLLLLIQQMIHYGQVKCKLKESTLFTYLLTYAHDTLAGNSRRKLARVIQRWKLATVTCFPALVFSSCENLARYSAMLYSTLDSGINGVLW